jgi:ergothioneine biosynthesis protein EgtB
MAVFTSDIVAERWAEAERVRCGDRANLTRALQDARQRTLQLFAAYEAALGAGLRVPQTHELNLPLWELGHIAWFSDWWIARNPELRLGIAANPHVARTPARLANADALYNSSEVPHASRWSLDLPDAHAVRADLAANLQATLTLLASSTEDDASLYFFRLALFHEDMHAEAAVYMAQTLGFDPFAQGATPMSTHAPEASQPLDLVATSWQLGRSGSGFAFDNELGTQPVAVNTLRIDSTPVSWARYLPFIESGAAQDPLHWSEDGWAWRIHAHAQAQRAGAAPRYLRQTETGNWETQRFGRWQAVNPNDSAVHVTAFEAQAWCHWAGRRLPTEAEWEAAACTLPGFQWGSVWEWTASAFAPYPGFEPHPYRDYAAPWFDGRPVLKGASPATARRMRHPKYRNFFTAERSDIFAGFRSVGT